MEEAPRSLAESTAYLENGSKVCFESVPVLRDSLRFSVLATCYADQRLDSAKIGPSNPPIHYRSIRMKSRKLLPGAFVIAVLVAIGLWLRNEVRIDSCLDRGGRWDKERQMCEGATE